MYVPANKWTLDNLAHLADVCADNIPSEWFMPPLYEAALYDIKTVRSVAHYVRE